MSLISDMTSHNVNLRSTTVSVIRLDKSVLLSHLLFWDKIHVVLRKWRLKIVVPFNLNKNKRELK